MDHAERANLQRLREAERLMSLRSIAQKAFANGRGLYYWRPSMGAWHVLVIVEV
jgi:hypothetical protein